MDSQKVRHIPIFVEGRDEPVINRDHVDSGSAPQPNANTAPQNSSNTSAFASAESFSDFPPHHQNHHNFGHPPMNFGTDFGQDMPMPTGSIFDRAKDFPVRDFFNMRAGSPRRSESPSGVNRQSPGGQYGQGQQYGQRQSQDRQVPIQRSTTPQQQWQQPQQHQQPQHQQPQQQRQQQQQMPHGQQQQPQQHQQQPQQPQQPEQPIPAKQKAIEDSITKIQKIQASVLELMGKVEKFDGKNRKEYVYLDEMLTQNLLKLDDIDAEGKENIKNARREAIKCINSLISLLEAKNDEAKAASESKSEPGVDTPTQNGVNGGSKNSSYDNVNNVKQTSSNNSVNMTNAEVSAEASLEAKVQEALQKDEQK